MALSLNQPVYFTPVPQVCAEILRKSYTDLREILKLTNLISILNKINSEIAVRGVLEDGTQEAPLRFSATLSYICNILCSAVKPIIRD